MTESPSTDEDVSSDTTRRSVLKAAGATAAVSLGGVAASGSAAGRDIEPVAADRAAIEAVLDYRAGDLLEALAADGVIESADVSALDTRPASFGTVLSDRRGAAVVRDAGVHRIQSTRRVDGGTLAVAVELETGEAYAFLRTDDGGHRVWNVDAGRFGDDVSTQDCSCSCSRITCDGTRSEICTCCDSDGENCEHVGFCDC